MGGMCQSLSHKWVFSREDIQMASKHVKIFSTSLIIREIQIKTMMRYHLIYVRIAIIKNLRNDKCGQGCREKGFSYTAGGNINWYTAMGYSIQRFLQKLRLELPYDPVFLLLGVFPKNTKTLLLKDICTSIFITALFTMAKI